MAVSVGDLTVHTNCIAAATMEEHAFDTPGMFLAASDSVVKGVYGDGNSAFSLSSVASIESMESWMILDRARSSARWLWWLGLKALD